MKNNVLIGALLVFASLLSAVSMAQGPASSRPGVASPALTAYRAQLDKYCVTCHNQRVRTAGLSLDTLALDSVPAHAETWEKVIRKLRSRLMPPAGSPRPDAALYDGFASWLESE